jgi:hypothetical protein
MISTKPSSAAQQRADDGSECKNMHSTYETFMCKALRNIDRAHSFIFKATLEAALTSGEWYVDNDLLPQVIDFKTKYPFYLFFIIVLFRCLLVISEA